MKRLFPLLFLCIVLTFTLSPAAYAAGTAEYASPEIGVSFSAPADLKIVSRDSYKNDPVVDALPFAMENLDEWFSGDYYFLGALESMYCTFTLRAYPGGHEFFLSSIESGELQPLMDHMANAFTERGLEVLSAETYPHPETTFLRYGYSDTDEHGSTDYTVTFYTAYGENTIRVDFWFMDSTGTPEQNALANGVIDSMKFSAQPGSSAASEESPAAAPTESPVTAAPEESAAEAPVAETQPDQPSQADPSKTIISCVLLVVVLAALFVLSRKIRRDKKAAAAAKAPAGPQTAASETRYCPHCGKELAPGSKFCASCGAQLPTDIKN